VSKIAIVIGHNAKAQGAVRVTDRVSEFVWNGRVAELIADHGPRNVKIFRRTPDGGYSREIDRVYAQVDAWGAAATVELHFNAAGTSTAGGCLQLSSGTRGSLALARQVHARTLAVMGNRDRGIEVRGRHERGGRSLWQGRSPCIIWEPYFGSNPTECAVAEQRIDELAEAVYRGAVAFLASR
jgi:N-acetylmuramoyl-L-alanine amidase